MHISTVVILVALFVVLVVADKDICCMPRGHKVSVRDTSTTIKNCTSSGCSTINTLIMNYIHYPDLDNYRYRLDFKGEAGQGPFFEGTTLGFITNKTSLLGYQFEFNDNECTCKKTTKPSGIYHITCVTDALTYMNDISIGVALKAQKYAKTNTKTNGVTTSVATHNFVAQTFAPPPKPDAVPLCALIHEDMNNRETDASGNLISSMTRSIEVFDFTPHADDESYVVPSHCPKSC
jgi:hypothetical protein